MMSEWQYERTREKMEKEYPILEFDSAETAMIEPRRVMKPIDVPEHAVACFFQDVLEHTDCSTIMPGSSSI